DRSRDLPRGGWRSVTSIPVPRVFSAPAFAWTSSGRGSREGAGKVTPPRAQEPGGAFRGPAERDADSETPLAPPAFRRDYHTTLVALLASFGATMGIAPTHPG